MPSVLQADWFNSFLAVAAEIFDYLISGRAIDPVYIFFCNGLHPVNLPATGTGKRAFIGVYARY